MKKWTSFVGAFILSYLFWILFLMQDFNILKLGSQELIVGVIVSYNCLRIFQVHFLQRWIMVI